VSGVGSGIGEELQSTSEIIKEVMAKFGVSEEIAGMIIAYCNTFAFEKMKKWTFNMKKRQKEKADYIYRLTRRLKRGDKSVLDELEKKILELCVET